MNKKGIFIVIAVVVVGLLCWLFLGNKSGSDEAQTFKVAAMLPLTGKGATAGENAEKVLRLCVEKWNEQGGVLGKKIEIEFFDVKNSEPKEGQFIARNIVSRKNKPNLVINVTSAVVLPIQPIFEQHKIIQVSLAPSDNLFAANPKYVIRNYPSDVSSGQKLVYEIKNTLKAPGIKVLYPNTEWGRSNSDAFEIEAKQQGISIVNAESYLEDDISFRNYISKLNLKNTDYLYIVGSQERIGRAVRQVRESGFSGIIIGGADLITKAALNVIGNQRENIYYSDIEKHESISELMRIFKEKYQTPIDEMSLYFYNGLDLILNAYSVNKTIDNDIIMENINGFSYDGYLGNMSVENNEILYSFVVKKLEDYNE